MRAEADESSEAALAANDGRIVGLRFLGSGGRAMQHQVIGSLAAAPFEVAALRIAHVAMDSPDAPFVAAIAACEATDRPFND